MHDTQMRKSALCLSDGGRSVGGVANVAATPRC